MHAIVGGRLEEMSRLASTFTSNAGQMWQLRGAIESTLTATSWSGPAAERFREQWRQFAPTLDRLHEALVEAGAEVGRRRDALEAATS